MTDHDTELAIQISHKFQRDRHMGRLEDRIIKALHSVRKEENDACAKVAETTFCSTKYDGVVVEIATAIRNRMKEKS